MAKEKDDVYADLAEYRELFEKNQEGFDRIYYEAEKEYTELFGKEPHTWGDPTEVLCELRHAIDTGKPQDYPKNAIF